MGWVIRYLSRSSKLNYTTNLMVPSRDFGHKVFANEWGISKRFFKIAWGVILIYILQSNNIFWKLKRLLSKKTKAKALISDQPAACSLVN